MGSRENGQGVVRNLGRERRKELLLKDKTVLEVYDGFCTTDIIKQSGRVLYHW